MDGPKWGVIGSPVAEVKSLFLADPFQRDPPGWPIDPLGLDAFSDDRERVEQP